MIDRRAPPGFGPRAADAIVFLLFGGVPLVASPAFWDQLASVKWYALETLAVAWLLVELLLCGSRGWPSAVRRAALPCLALFALPLPGALRLGLDWAAPPLAERLTVVGLALCSFWYFERTGRDLRAVRAGLVVSLALTTAFGAAQALGVQPWPALTAGDQRSALFGNVNMAAELVGFAVIALIATGEPRPSGAWAMAREAALAFGFAELFFLASRSTFLALGAALLLLVWARRLSVRRLAALLVAAAVGGSTLLAVGSWASRAGTGGPEHLLRADVQQHKRDSSTLRFAAWDSTIALVRDHPWGLGLGNFPDAFIPYQLEGSPRPDEHLYFRSPHNEPLRMMAEGGVFAPLLAAGLGLALAAALWRSGAIARGRSLAGGFVLAGLVFYLVEAAFQFPLDVAMGALDIAVLFGLAGACLEPDVAPSKAPGASARFGRVVWTAAGLLAAFFVAVTALREARSEWLFVNAPKDRSAQARACRLNPRNLPACVTAAFLQGRAGDEAAARGTLTRVLERSPYYFPAIKLLGEQALFRGERRTGCRYLWIYDEMFRRTSSVHHYLGRYCEPAWFASFSDTIPMPHYGAFPFAP